MNKQVNQGDNDYFQDVFEETTEENNENNKAYGKVSGYPTINKNKAERLLPTLSGKIHDSGYINMSTTEEMMNMTEEE